MKESELPPPPAHSCPNQHKPEAKPVEAKPPEAKPTEVKQAETKPVEAKPVEAKAVEAKPVEATPAEAKPREVKATEAKPVIEVQEKKGHEKETSDGPRPKPAAVCTRCGAVSYTQSLINGQCAQTVGGKRCVGVNGSALNVDDWKQCAACAGTGSAGSTRCGPCDGVGWIYNRNKGKR